MLNKSCLPFYKFNDNVKVLSPPTLLQADSAEYMLPWLNQFFYHAKCILNFFHLVSLLLLIVESKVHIKSMLNRDPSRTKVVCQNGNISREQKKFWQKKDISREIYLAEQGSRHQASHLSIKKFIVKALSVSMSVEDPMHITLCIKTW
jgi:hypothetical protein